MPFFSNPSDVTVTDGIFVDVGGNLIYYAKEPGMLSINFLTDISLHPPI
jgi:hypothetical protein